MMGRGEALEKLKELRERTGAGVLECQQALREAGGDPQKAEAVLRQRGFETAVKKAGRVANQGCVESYVHAGKRIGVLIEVNCETDFVARCPEFQQLVKDLAMQVAAAAPQYVRREDVPAAVLDQVTTLPSHHGQAAREAGRQAFFTQACLLEQGFIKDPGLTIRDHLAAVVGKLKENIVVRRFVRYELGEAAGH